MTLAFASAWRAVEASVAASRAHGHVVGIVALDAGGHLVAAARMDGAYLSAVRVAESKAFTALNFRVPTTAMIERLPDKDYQLMISVADPRLSFLAGGLPILADGEVIGGFGVSGATPALDAEIAQAGLAAI